MGLDSYLYKKTFVGANFEHRNVKGMVKLAAEGKSFPIKLNRISDITEHVGYWRKANQIHAWFVKNVQKGVDECQLSYVPLEKLKELLAICQEVLKDRKKAPGLLPAQSGFFFGSTDYDEYYFSDLKDTVKILTPLIKEIEKERAKKLYSDIYYQSSW